jgi:hypothetical protein
MTTITVIRSYPATSRTESMENLDIITNVAKEVKEA